MRLAAKVDQCYTSIQSSSVTYGAVICLPPTCSIQKPKPYKYDVKSHTIYKSSKQYTRVREEVLHRNDPTTLEDTECPLCATSYGEPNHDGSKESPAQVNLNGCHHIFGHSCFYKLIDLDQPWCNRCSFYRTHWFHTLFDDEKAVREQTHVEPEYREHNGIRRASDSSPKPRAPLTLLDFINHNEPQLSLESARPRGLFPRWRRVLHSGRFTDRQNEPEQSFESLLVGRRSLFTSSNFTLIRR